MPKKKPYVVNGKEFRTLNDIRGYIRTVRDSYPDNVYIGVDDLAFMLSLLLRHENADNKIGCGVHAMYVKTDEVYKNRGFWLVREDGTETDFSFEKCLRNKPESQLIKFKKACRTTIVYEVLSFKNLFFSPERGFSSRCLFTGDTITPEHSHVDHAPPWTFDNIVGEFIKQEGIDVDRVEIGGTMEDGVVQNTLKDDGLRKKFLSFHNDRAELRVISPKANLSIVKKSLPKR